MKNLGMRNYDWYVLLSSRRTGELETMKERFFKMLRLRYKKYT